MICQRTSDEIVPSSSANRHPQPFLMPCFEPAPLQSWSRGLLTSRETVH
jgi:hypothetical protein